MGKWTKLRKELVRFVEAPDWQARIDLIKKAKPSKEAGQTNGIAGLNRQQLFTEYVTAKDQKDYLEEQIKGLNTRLEAITQVLVQDFEDSAEEKVTNALGTFGLRDDPYASIKDQKAFMGWIEANELQELLTVNYQTMSGMVKKGLENGEPLPDGVEVFMKVKIGYTAAR